MFKNRRTIIVVFLPAFLISIGAALAPEHISISGFMPYIWMALVHIATLYVSRIALMITTILIPYPDYYAKLFGGTQMVCSWRVGIWNTKFGLMLGKAIILAADVIGLLVVFPVINMLPNVIIRGMGTYVILFAAYTFLRILLTKDFPLNQTQKQEE